MSKKFNNIKYLLVNTDFTSILIYKNINCLVLFYIKLFRCYYDYEPSGVSKKPESMKSSEIGKIIGNIYKLLKKIYKEFVKLHSIISFDTIIEYVESLLNVFGK